jgi:hypothetical protein
VLNFPIKLQAELGLPLPAEDVTDGGREAIELKQSFRGNHNYFISYLVRNVGQGRQKSFLYLFLKKISRKVLVNRAFNYREL